MVSVWTIGHSNHRLESFLDLLEQHQIDVLVDVRSRPRSRWPHFNQQALCRSIEEVGHSYIWLPGLGGMPDRAELRLPNGEADFEAIRASDDYRSGLAEVISLAADGRVALMCSEGDPKACHRFSALAPDLIGQGLDVRHVLRDGKLLGQLA